MENKHLKDKEITKHYISTNTVLAKKVSKDNTNFLDNEIVLESPDSEKPFTETDFKNRIKQEVSDFIDQSFDNIVVLAGAGASVVSDDQGGIDDEFGKTMNMIAANIAKELGDIKSEETVDSISDNEEKNDKFFTLQDLANISKYEMSVKKDDQDKFNPEFNLEDFLSNLLTYEQFLDENEQKEKFIATKDKILDLIQTYTDYSFDQNKLKHGGFLNILSKKVKKPNKLTIVTTNYDTLFEEAAEILNFTVMDGFTFSFNPYFDSDMFDWNLVRDIPNVKTRELEYKSNIINLLKIHGSLTWERTTDNENRIHRKYKGHIKRPIMVFPSTNKYMQSYEEPYFELFTKFQELLRKPNTLLITTGFSFADNHIAKMITQAIQHNAGLAVLVSDHNIEQGHSNWKELNTLLKDHFRIAFLKASFNSDLIDYIGG